MAFRYELYRRLEPAQPFENLNRGFLAEVHDPVWFLGRQWQLGEHQGEDASSPVVVRYRAERVPIATSEKGLPDPQIVPPEAIVEAEPDDWWTPGRRIRIGAAAGAHLLAANAAPELLLEDLPTPYDRFNGQGYDGLELYRRRVALNLVGLDPDPFAGVPAVERKDLWDPAGLWYQATFRCGGRSLGLERHTGGQIDWYSVDADGPLPVPDPLPDAETAYPGRLRYPGSPQPRWWQIEDAHVDIGGFPPDRSHFATMLLIDLLVSHSDDWFLFPVGAPAGHAVTLEEVTIRDSFGDEWQVAPPADWTLFAVTGLAETSLLVWPTVTTPLTGSVLENVVLGIDEDANVVWAVERRVGGRDVPTPPRAEPVLPAAREKPAVATDRKRYRYRPSSALLPHWHPYVIDEVGGLRRFVQGRLADLDARPPALLPEPRARLLADPAALPGAPAHQIDPSTVPSLGLRLERGYLLARGTDGQPVLWMQRRRLPLLAPPALELRFDTMQEATLAEG